jgi:hypothetical protein
MKKLFSFFFISIFFLSCQKDKQASIAGVWKEVEFYMKDSNGNYSWNKVLHGFPYFLSLRDDGTYSGFQCAPLARGVYQYDHITREIRMQDITSGTTNTCTVSALDEDYMILNYGMTSLGEYRVKFTRNQ